ncbi:MAG: glycosyltransferase, partial [Chthoniobacterales bacterium]|nr:glycosyltransferase [Chthoniobacterales bacterium]
MKIVILGLSITSSWGNGHATTYRGLVRELSANGHDILFLERDQAWYAENRDLPQPPFGATQLYRSLAELKRRFAEEVRDAECVIVGSYVPDGIAVSKWVTEQARGVTAFYDIDTPVTLSAVERGECDYISSEVIGRFSLYLSFTGGPTLRKLEGEYGSPRARVLYCSVDPEMYFAERASEKWALGYLGTYSDDRQPTVDRLLARPAAEMPKERFVVAGPQYPDSIDWPQNVERIMHIEPKDHRVFYNAQRFTLNVTRADMIRAGYSPSVRLFEAAACGTPIITDKWPGLTEFFQPGEEILIAERTEDVVEILREMPEGDRLAMGERARERVLAAHTAAHRAVELEGLIEECRYRARRNVVS